MRTPAKCLTAFAGLALSAAGIAQEPPPGDDTGIAFVAALSGAQEVTPPDAPTTPSPGVETDTSALARVVFAPDLSSFDFVLTVENGRLVTASHLHCGRAGQNGPVIVFLSTPSSEGADVNGVLGEGTRTNADIVAGAADCEAAIGRPVRNIASLAAAAFEGLIYANVHTVANPAGEVRGQLIPE